MLTQASELFTQTPDGHIHWLDTSFGGYQEVAESAERWAEAARVHGSDWFNLRALRELRSLGAGLAAGQVYSWSHPPMLGGARTLDNVTFTPLTVHVSAAGRLACAIKDLPPGAKITDIRWTPLS